MAGAILIAIAKINSIIGDDAANATINKLSEKVQALKELPWKVDRIRMKLTIMGKIIQQIGTVYLTDELVKKLDWGVEIEGQIQQVIQLKDQWLQPSQLVPHHDQLAEIERQRSQDSFPEFVKDEDLVGIEENRKLLTGWIYSEEQASTVITVSGMGGLGKSTLVTNIYEREKVNFPVHAWIVVTDLHSRVSAEKATLEDWAYGTTSAKRYIDKMDVHDLKEEIKRKLQNRKCLIVLDDVWEQEVYFKIHDVFQTLQESHIIITTRKDHVGAIASFGHHLELQPLCGPDAFELFCRRAFHSKKDHKCPEELQEIAGEIVKRCHAWPAASSCYNRQLVVIKTTNKHLESNIQPASDLFPEDYPMSRETLVRLWVAEGFVLCKENYTLEGVAEGKLMELINRNMLEVVDYDELRRVSTCKMHHIMRDLALCVAKEEKFGSANDYGELVQVDKNVRRLSLCGWNVNVAPKVKFPYLRTIVAQGIISSSPDMVSSIMSESNYLTVLELRDSEITEVPAFIGNLFHLQYIGVRRTKVKSFPESIEKLLNLHTLDIKQTQIEKLPRGIVKVKKLRQLLADRLADDEQSEFRYLVGVEAPKGLLNLQELQTLETVQANKDLAEQLKKLMQLRSIWIDNVSAADCANLFATLSAMPFLSSVLICAGDVNETLCFQALVLIFPTLHRLIVRGRWANETLEYPIFRNHGKHLKYLALSWCQLGEDPLGFLAPHVPNLTYLSFNRVKSASTLVLSAGCFPHLKTLVLKKMPDVKQLEIGHGALPCIEGLYIMSLGQLDKVPQGIELLLSLKKLWLLYLHREFRTQWLTNEMYWKMRHVPEFRV
ncbi:unnamed protein product [Miscanthus lutarioriparius]|uniref:Uncharacterized protein n=1 Tax=Miscanthus lutarioriparius TaxID=422564 RepID=A0A811QIY5_9POAL|nr:unnamed protein product [Miscanthus lutarioriparius]